MRTRILHDGPKSFTVEYMKPSPFGPQWPPEWTYWGSFPAQHLAEHDAKMLEGKINTIVYESPPEDIDPGPINLEAVRQP